jgi:serine/threonine protein kinase
LRRLTSFRFVGKHITEQSITLLIEMCALGSLRLHIRQVVPSPWVFSHSSAQARGSASRTQSIVERTLLDFAAQITSGMAALGRYGILHHNLSAFVSSAHYYSLMFLRRTVLLSDSLCCKLSEFGFARESDAYSAARLRWKAHECLNGSLWSSSADVWSFGVTLWELASLGATPYVEHDSMSSNVLVLIDLVQASTLCSSPPCCGQELDCRRPQHAQLRWIASFVTA